MWWDEFEMQPTNTFNTYDSIEKRSVDSNEMRLGILNKEISADFLQATKASINLALDKTHGTIKYENALAAFHNKINKKFLPKLSSSNKRKAKRIIESGTHGGGRGGIFQDQGGRYQGHGGRGRYTGRGRGRSGRGHGGRGNYNLSRQDDRMVRCNDGSQLEVQLSYDFTKNERHKSPEA